MPQMAPISWLMLFIIFSITLVMFSTMNYFMTMPSSPKYKISKHLHYSSMNWKW